MCLALSGAEARRREPSRMLTHFWPRQLEYAEILKLSSVEKLCTLFKALNHIFLPVLNDIIAGK
jgi:hypothetical protein